MEEILIDNIISELLQLFLDKALQGNSEYFYILILLIISILLFIQYKKNVQESIVYEENQIKESIKAYASALLAIKRYNANTIDFDLLLIELYKIIPYETSNLRTLLYEMDKDNINIENITQIIKDNYSSIKYMFRQNITKSISDSVFDNITYSVHKSKIVYVLQPLIYTFFTILVLITSISLFFDLQRFSIYEKILFGIFIYAVFIYILIFLTMADKIKQNKFDKKFKPISMFLIFLLSPFFSFIPIYNIGIYIFISYELFYTYYNIKQNNKKIQNNKNL